MQYVIKRKGKNYGFVYNTWISYSEISSIHRIITKPGIQCDGVGACKESSVDSSMSYMPYQDAEREYMYVHGSTMFTSKYILAFSCLGLSIYDGFTIFSAYQRPALYKNHST